MRHLESALAVSERRGCRAVAQARSTQRYVGRRRARDGPLIRRMRELAGRHLRFGYRRITALLKREGWTVNRKRVLRLWRQEGLRVPPRRRKYRRLGHSANSCQVRRARYRGHVWSYDFVADETTDGRPLRFLTVVDEHSRENTALEVDRSMTAERVIAALARAFREYGPPACLRSDNGPEFIAQAIQTWLKASGVQTLYIQPGAPWENGYNESFNGHLRDEFLDRELFGSVIEAEMLAVDWRRYYNHERPHSALNYQTPAACAAGRRRPGSAPRAGGSATPGRRHETTARLS